LKKFRHI